MEKDWHFTHCGQELDLVEDFHAKHPFPVSADACAAVFHSGPSDRRLKSKASVNLTRSNLQSFMWQLSPRFYGLFAYKLQKGYSEGNSTKYLKPREVQYLSEWRTPEVLSQGAFALSCPEPITLAWMRSKGLTMDQNERANLKGYGYYIGQQAYPKQLQEWAEDNGIQKVDSGMSLKELESLDAADVEPDAADVEPWSLGRSGQTISVDDVRANDLNHVFNKLAYIPGSRISVDFHALGHAVLPEPDINGVVVHAFHCRDTVNSMKGMEKDWHFTHCRQELDLVEDFHAKHPFPVSADACAAVFHSGPSDRRLKSKASVNLTR